MVKELPPTFDEFSLEAKIDFLKEARNTHDLLTYLYEYTGAEYEPESTGPPPTDVLATLYAHLYEEDPLPNQDAMQADETQ